VAVVAYLVMAGLDPAIEARSIGSHRDGAVRRELDQARPSDIAPDSLTASAMPRTACGSALSRIARNR